MNLKLQAIRYPSPRTPEDGVRLGTVRYLPRGVRKERYAADGYFDVWLPILAPSKELLSTLKDKRLATDAFFTKYRREMAAPDQRHVIELIAAVARHTPVTIGCFCEDEAMCHRSVLLELILKAAKTRG